MTEIVDLLKFHSKAERLWPKVEPEAMQELENWFGPDEGTSWSLLNVLSDEIAPVLSPTCTTYNFVVLSHIQEEDGEPHPYPEIVILRVFCLVGGYGDVPKTWGRSEDMRITLNVELPENFRGRVRDAVAKAA